MILVDESMYIEGVVVDILRYRRIRRVSQLTSGLRYELDGGSIQVTAFLLDFEVLDDVKLVLVTQVTNSRARATSVNPSSPE